MWIEIKSQKWVWQVTYQSALALWEPGAKLACEPQTYFRSSLLSFLVFPMRNTAGSPRALGLSECYWGRRLAYGLLSAACKILQAKSWAPGKVCGLLRIGNNKKYVSFDFHAFILYTSERQEDQGEVGEKGYVTPAFCQCMRFCHGGCMCLWTGYGF